jgi:hypothetical protein
VGDFFAFDVARRVMSDGEWPISDCRDRLNPQPETVSAGRFSVTLQAFATGVDADSKLSTRRAMIGVNGPLQAYSDIPLQWLAVLADPRHGGSIWLYQRTTHRYGDVLKRRLTGGRRGEFSAIANG